VRIGKDLVLTGYVFKAPIRYDGRQISLSIEGSSKTQDLVDCAATKPNQWQEQPLAAASFRRWRWSTRSWWSMKFPRRRG
jgi:prophage tail gpP-like protein